MPTHTHTLTHTHTHLCSGRARDNGRGGVRDAHFVEKHFPVLGDLDLACAAHQHLHGAAGTQVGLQQTLKGSCRIDVCGERVALGDHVSALVDSLDGHA
jgi:hypothetical protein